MDDGMITTSDMLRLVGTMAVCVGLAWVAQVLGFDVEGSAFSRLMWVMGAAAIAGAGVGSIFSATQLREEEVPVRH